MRLKEYEGKEIFTKYNINIPKGFVISSLNQLSKKNNLNSEEFTVKAQILIGKRGKLGGVKFANKINLKKSCSTLLNKEIEGIKVKEVLIEEKLFLEKQIYLGITISRKEDSYILIYSDKGGAEIEEISKSDPSSIYKHPFTKIDLNKLPKFFNKSKYKNELAKIVYAMYKILLDYDAILVEINPLVLSNKKFIAIDSKIILDDNALYRHPEFIKVKEAQLSKLEKEAFHQGISFVQLKGTIAVISNGAGLVMATLDLLDYYGAKPANFLDIGAGAGMKEIFEGLNILLKENPKGILINIFAGMTRCDEIALGIVKFKNKRNTKIPFVVRMIGTNEDEAKSILKKQNIEMLDSMEQCVRKIVNMVK